MEVTLTSSEPGAQIRYTLDGTVPGTNDKLYESPIKMSGPAVLRTRAFKQGLTRSITAQQLFIIEK